MSRINKHGIDIDAIQVGDRVEVVVARTNFKDSRFAVGTAIWHLDDDILSHTPAPRPLQAGDWVNVEGSSTNPWQVVAVSEDKAWVRSNMFGNSVLPVRDFTRTTPPEGERSSR